MPEAGGDRVGWISALTPVFVVVLGGAGWLIKYLITTARDSPEHVDIMQGQTIPVTALPDYLQSRNEQCEDENRAYMIALVKAGIDPYKVLRDAGLESSDEEMESAD